MPRSSGCAGRWCSEATGRGNFHNQMISITAAAIGVGLRDPAVYATRHASINQTKMRDVRG